MTVNTPKISIIIPVLFEADIINRTIDAIYNQNMNNVEVIVIDGDENRSTIKMIEEKKVIRLSSSSGRSIQMNYGADMAKGDIILFLHSDTLLSENSLIKIIETMKNKNISAGAFDLTINAKHFAFRVIEKFATYRSRLTRIPFGDQAIFIRKDIFKKLCGYKEIPVMEDIDLMQRIKKAQLKIRFISPGVLTSARRWKEDGIIYCTLRNWCILILYFSGVSATRLFRYNTKSFKLDR